MRKNWFNFFEICIGVILFTIVHFRLIEVLK
ncbi:hypothetical protein LCGC14_1319820 [marine sediment metagenome]|uniref:Uncharacterized protein n=1 Tax=marine sediment metagenome TaxID=412755 RepID=A0A0F9N0M2_9ZZZZ